MIVKNAKCTECNKIVGCTYEEKFRECIKCFYRTVVCHRKENRQNDTFEEIDVVCVKCQMKAKGD